MTAKETERLAKVEQKVDDLKESTDAGFAELKQNMNASNKALSDKLDAFISRADRSFLTVAQARVAAWFVGFVIGVATLGILIWSHITK